MTTDPAKDLADYSDKRWLLAQARALLDFHVNAVDPKGGFRTLDLEGQPLPPGPGGAERALHEVTRMVHAYAMATRLDYPKAREIVDHGIEWLLTRQYDAQNGGFFWSVDDNGPVDPLKQAYGHAFVLLAAASAHQAGHGDAEKLRDLAMETLWTRFWEEEHGAVSDTFDADWTNGLAYRGQNANMHLTEALMAAHDAWGDAIYLTSARRIAERIINVNARAAGWVVPEHFHPDWSPDPDFAGDVMFRPSGTTPGHALEWARLVLELWQRTGRMDDWMPEAAQGLFRQAVGLGWLPDGGFAYTLANDGTVSRDWRLWWPCAEAINAAWALDQVAPDPFWRGWYGRVWSFVDRNMIDHRHGGWFPEIGPDGEPKTTVFAGKPDIYHALQACLIPAGVMGPAYQP
ncbi:AGE family epimerase/isomerase [Paenirhodobacter populi]|uniref:AGE family epimerase/isomerase n=1 Tax=Paenirhodobacter populi TaxID=2306993 RepID=UPI000FE383BC|nr:AGE family epimerase/isomerase [Sinirhodobacter populi]RWR06864.1 AGE family epimerase/isomerase [Sinirhodobacter populi]